MATRNRAATEERILGAVGEVLARDGFAALGINTIAKQAGVDKVLIYRYFGGLPELLQSWAASGRFWPRVQDLLGPDAQALLGLPLAERYARFFEHFIDELRARPLTLEILASELHERNELTIALEAEREAWGEEATRVLGADELQAHPAVPGLTLLLVAGVQYLLLRARRTRVFGGVDIQSAAGWDLLKASVSAMAQQLMQPPGSAAPGRRLVAPRKRATVKAP
jgi:AcrR family transcriptional regulator